MPRAASRRFARPGALAGAVVSIGLVIGGCRGIGADAVPGCPRCGDPLTFHDTAGEPRVRCRLRVPDDGGRVFVDASVGVLPWALSRASDDR